MSDQQHAPRSPGPAADQGEQCSSGSAEQSVRPASDARFEELYDELRDLARGQMLREAEGHTLTPTSLVNEAYLRLAGQRNISDANRTRFLGAAAQTMRRVLVDHARARLRDKRGAGARAVPLEELEEFLSDDEAAEVVALDDAMNRLAELSPRSAVVVEQRFFAGLTLDETAELLGVSVKTVQRDWLAARAWLRKEVRQGLRWA